MNFRLPLVLIICATLLVVGCSPHKAVTAITGTVGYGSVVEFANKAKLQLILNDVSAEGAAPEIATTSVDIKQLPFEYTLPYEAANINSAHRYTISARISVNGTVKYATDSAIEVLTQGKDNRANFSVIAVGTAETGSTESQVAAEIFPGEIRTGTDISLYRAGVVAGHINWLEEDRTNGTPTPAHNTYQFNGALLTHYRDTSPLEIAFDEGGKPKSVLRGGKSTDVGKEMPTINTVRNRAALLRSDALSKRESLMHRTATKNDVGG